jgi:hypothetical protein
MEDSNHEKVKDVKLRFDPKLALKASDHFKHMLFLDCDRFGSLENLEMVVNFMIQRYPFDFTWTQSFEPEWFKMIMSVGFLPIASEYGQLVSTFSNTHTHSLFLFLSLSLEHIHPQKNYSLSP